MKEGREHGQLTPSTCWRHSLLQTPSSLRSLPLMIQQKQLWLWRRTLVTVLESASGHLSSAAEPSVSEEQETSSRSVRNHIDVVFKPCSLLHCIPWACHSGGCESEGPRIWDGISVKLQGEMGPAGLQFKDEEVPSHRSSIPHSPLSCPHPCPLE